jgi:hypothetical protein
MVFGIQFTSGHQIERRHSGVHAWKGHNELRHGIGSPALFSTRCTTGRSCRCTSRSPQSWQRVRNRPRRRQHAPLADRMQVDPTEHELGGGPTDSEVPGERTRPDDEEQMRAWTKLGMSSEPSRLPRILSWMILNLLLMSSRCSATPLGVARCQCCRARGVGDTVVVQVGALYVLE